MKNITLKKDVGRDQIKAYFAKVLELKHSGIEFPVDLDEVWPLAYARKDKAVRALKFEFLKNIDFQALPQKGEQVWGGHNKDIYKLSVTCLEFFIARKVRPVFEVYREVFHAAEELHRQLAWEGIPTIYHNGRVWVNYRSALRATGLSVRSGSAAKRKQTHAEEFEKFFNQNFITVVFAEVLRRQITRQTSISFTTIK